MKIAINNRLSFRLARNTVILTLVLGTMMSVIQVALDFLEEDRSFDHQFKAIVDISHAPASQIAYNIDARLAHQLLEGLLEHPAIIHAEIADTEQRVLATLHQPKLNSSYRWLSDLLFQPERSYTETLHVPQLEDDLLGNLSIVVDTYPKGAKFLQRSALTVLSGFLRSLILSAVLLILFYLTLSKPLVKVISAVSEVNPETPEKVRLPVPPGHESDEIGVLVNSTNNHLQAIDGHLDKLKKAEARLTSYSEHLELIVESRTNELSQKNIQLIKSNHDLRVAKEEAVQRAKARANFLASMSHEMRTPFNGVLGMIDLTLEEPLSAKQREQLNIAHRSGLALLDLLNDILDISKVEAGKLTLESISFDLRETTEDVCRLMATNAHAKRVELNTLVAENFPDKVYGDPTRIRQIISNLASNAIKFTEYGYINISVNQLADRRTEIAVKDTGVGIDSRHLENIFSPFAQGDKQTTRKFGGTGLGLTLCKQLIQHMRGDLTVESIVNEGSTFRVLLPLETDDTAKPFAINSELEKFRYLLVYEENNYTFQYIADEFRHWHLTLHTLPYKRIQDLDLTHRSFQKNTVILFDSKSIAPLLAAPAAIKQLKLILVARRSESCEPSQLQAMNIRQFVHAPLGRGRLYRALCSTTGITAKPQPPSEQDTMPKIASGQHILLVEDNNVNQLVAKAILARLGYHVTIAGNGKEALDAVHDSEYDIVLMDCHMPVLDGYDASREIRKEPRFDHLPIIAITANVMPGDKEKCLDCGMNDYLTKPYDSKVLASKLRKWLTVGEPIADASNS